MKQNPIVPIQREVTAAVKEICETMEEFVIGYAEGNPVDKEEWSPRLMAAVNKRDKAAARLLDLFEMEPGKLAEAIPKLEYPDDLLVRLMHENQTTWIMSIARLYGYEDGDLEFPQAVALVFPDMDAARLAEEEKHMHMGTAADKESKE